MNREQPSAQHSDDPLLDLAQAAVNYARVLNANPFDLTASNKALKALEAAAVRYAPSNDAGEKR